MTKRAIAGEAALGALLQTPTEALQQEGFVWNMMAYPLKRYGPTFLKNGVAIVTGALVLASSATSLAAAQKNKKKQEDAGLDQGPAEEPADSGEADIDRTESAETAEADFLAALGNSS